MCIRSAFVLLLLAVHFLALAAPSLASDDLVAAFTEGESEEEGEAEEVQPGSELGIVPAVETPPEPVDETEAPWTQRFLAPTVMVLGLVGLAGSALYYGLRIRGRYKLAD